MARESLPRQLAREYMLHRVGGGRHGRYYGRRPSYGSYWMRRHHRGPFGGYRPRRNVEVRGCGCCLPIPLALTVGSGLGLKALIRARAG